MTSVFKTALVAICVTTLGMSASVAWAKAHEASQPQGQSNVTPPALRTVLPFDEKTWAHVLQHGPRPVAYLFTTSYCSTCPAAFAVLKKAVQQRKDKPELNAVMMDVAGPQAMRHATHFLGMTQMYAFDGFEPAIRQAVDPAWPNVTPYVVLLDAHGQTQRVIGPPTPAMIKRWLAAR
jgi:thiol-disulfide isomerase/thioredoxin